MVFSHVLLRSTAAPDVFIPLHVSWDSDAEPARLHGLVLGGLVAWTLLQFVLLFYVRWLYVQRKRADPFWEGATDNVLWVGPVRDGVLDNVPDLELRDLELRIKREVERNMKDYKIVGEVKSVRLWKAKDAGDVLREKNERYAFKRPFALVELSSEEAANQALKHGSNKMLELLIPRSANTTSLRPYKSSRSLPTQLVRKRTGQLAGSIAHLKSHMFYE